MKQEMISYLSTIKEDIFNISSYLYNNPEESFYEYKAYNYIINFLKEKNFKITESYLDISTAFHAEYGSGHPKICYVCEYDAMTKDGHVTGHNLISAMSIGAALCLKESLKNFKTGTVVILGCPGEFVNGAKITMSKQGAFKDIDVVLMAHPDIENAETGTSMALLPIKIKYISEKPSVFSENGEYCSMDACSLIFNSISLLKNGFKRDCSIDNFKVVHSNFPHNLPRESEISFYIRAPKMSEACEIEKRIKNLTESIASVMNLKYEMSMPELPYDELIPNRPLSRIFAHNLKEVGIIDTGNQKNTYAGLSLGTVSHIVPCIQPYISIVKDSNVKYSSPEFAKATISSFAQDNILKAASALAMTGLDLLEKEELLKEVKMEFYNTLKEHEFKPCSL